MGALKGLSGKAYRNTGSLNSPVYSEITQLKEPKLPFDFKPADTSARGTGGIATVIPTLTDLKIGMTLVYDHTDSNVAALMTAAFAKSSVGLAFCDGDITVTGSTYVRVEPAYFTKWEKQEELEGAQMVEAEIAPGFGATPVTVTTV